MNRIENKISTRARLEAVPYSFLLLFSDVCDVCALFPSQISECTLNGQPEMTALKG